MELDLMTLAAGRDDCPCGLPHHCGIQNILLAPGAVSHTGELLSQWKRILLVADHNTFALCGDDVTRQLGASLQDTLIYESEGFLVPDETAIETLMNRVQPDTDYILGIGSGVINDLCKYVSFKKGLDYAIITTAPSMDGYASVHAAMIIGGAKVTYEAHMVHTVIADVELLRNAPMEMIRAGYGDIVGKFSALNDWKLSCAMYDEYFCQYVYDLIYDATLRVAPLGKDLQNRDADAVSALMHAILAVGIAMAFIGNSRPASGSEHHLSHYFEVTSLLRKEPYFLHGIDVAYATVDTQIMREAILALDEPVPAPVIGEADRNEAIRRIYETAADSIIALQKKFGRYDADLAGLIREKWAEIRAVLSEVPAAETIRDYMASVGLPMEEYYDMYNEKKRADGFFWAKDLKDRFTVLWVWYTLIGKV